MLSRLLRNSRVTRVMFLAAAIFALVMASLPNPPQLPGQPSDKLQHIAAFVILTLLARLAWPSVNDLWLLVALCGFGGLIELIQAIPELHREASTTDWAADSHAILATLLLLAVLRKIAAIAQGRQLNSSNR